MTNVIVDPVGNFFISQVLAAFAGLFGGLSISFFWQPKKLHRHGRFSAGLIIGSISVGATSALGGIVSRWLGMNFNEADTAMGLGYVVGAVSVGVIAWLANFFNRREDSDILEVAGELKRVARGIKTRTPSGQLKAPRTRAVNKTNGDDENAHD
ncbi:MAG: hypothetical protein LKK36_19990 [Ewingella americana]|jgi:MFS family permease|uniref:Uncharacterized protein n=2 Tax=Ewingella americana TaxID=41202 RepID=A0A085G3H8_EWIA3|nr:hypothetical protein [Ewingella americana]KAA8725670.1 hypothetical protein F4W05_21300 [Ewingella americana]KFC78273.1 hypothetical protein GEAM_3882 [Ewingella americana ATCC 33852]MCI1680639.1 hypothetical protein [Ewingella americana]MCI1856432.1 hypothetical protein [Ewingella americana]MCI1864038.1 hypothetical protein [Ewingella americana]